MTLSHCWGGRSHIKLTMDNTEDFQSNIPCDDLPKTFLEAISVVKHLGIAYLWIDALCIIQDSPSDWACEAAKMPKVYANSFLNIQSCCWSGAVLERYR
jgi:hypothetical protein